MNDRSEDRVTGDKPSPRRSKAAGRKSDHRQRPSSGAEAAERASAGMGTGDSDPTEWLFGDSLRHAARAAARPY